MRRLLLMPLAATVLCVTAGRPDADADVLQHGGPTAALTVPLVAVAALVAWAALAWLLLIGLLTCGTELRGPLGRLSAALLARVAPAAVRRAVALTLGAGLALGGGVGAASAAGAAPTSAVASTSQSASPGLDWPGLDLPDQAPARREPAPATSPAAPAPALPTGAVVVRPGDSLWSVAARRLPPTATAHDVAAAWPAWWSANRTVIGADPDVLRPGQTLTPPAATEQP